MNQPTQTLTQEHGVWVSYVGESLSASTVEDVIRQIRDERDWQNLGVEMESPFL